MGFTLRYILGLALVLHFSSANSISSWERYVREAILTEAPQSSSEKAVTIEEKTAPQLNSTNAILSVEPLKDDSKPKTDKVTVNKVYNRNDIFTTESNRLRSKIDSDLYQDDEHSEQEKEKEKEADDEHYTADTTYDYPSSDSGRSINFEIKKFTPEYKNKNGVHRKPQPSPEDKFSGFDDKFTFKGPDFSYFERTTEYKIPHYSFFDHDHDDDFHNSKEDEPHLSESKDSTSFDITLDRDRLKDDNDTKVDMDFLKMKRFEDKFEPSPKKDKNSTRKNVVTEKRTSINYNSSFNKTEILGDKGAERGRPVVDDDEFRFSSKPRLNNYESTTHKNIIYSSVVKKNNVSSKVISVDDDEDRNTTPPSVVRIIDATTHNTLIYHPTTRKNTVLTKPPALNNSHVSLLNNKIESETIKNVDTTTIREATTRRPIRKGTVNTIRVPTTRRSNTLPRVTSTARVTTTSSSAPPLILSTQETTTTFRSTTTTQLSSTIEPIVVASEEVTVGTASTTETTVPKSTASTATVTSNKDAAVSSSTVGNSSANPINNATLSSTTTSKTVSTTSKDIPTSSVSVSITSDEIPTSSVSAEITSQHIPTSSALSPSTSNNSIPSSTEDSANQISTTDGSISSSTKDTTVPASTNTIAASVPISTTDAITSTSTTVSSVSTSTRQAAVSETTPGKAQTRGEKEIYSYVPTRNTLINISKRGSVRFKSPTTQAYRVRSTFSPRPFDTTTTRYRSYRRSRPTERTTTESEKEQINPLLSDRPVASSTETDSVTATKRELSSTLKVDTEKSPVEQTIDKTEAAVSSTTTENLSSSSQGAEIGTDSTTSRIISTTISRSSAPRRRVTLRNFAPKIITPRYVTTTTTTTTATAIALTDEETEPAKSSTEHLEETQNITETSSAASSVDPTENQTVAESEAPSSESSSSRYEVDSPTTEENMNYTITDNNGNSSRYTSEIETAMNNSYVVTSSTTEEYSYDVTVTSAPEDSPETSTAASAPAADNTNLVPKLTEKTTTLNDDYDDEEPGDEDEKLPSQTDEAEHSTHGHEAKSFDDNDNKEEEERTEADEYTESPYYSEPDGIETTTNFELQRPKEGNGGTIAAIVISCVGAVCLIILAALLILVRKRQKRFNYGQRCTPVTLDAYSMDNVSVYNSVRRKGIMRASKRSYGNPAFEDPDSLSHPLNFPALAKFATNLEDLKAEFEEIPQVTARTSELPEGCDVKNRYANVIPLPETRVFLTPIDGVPNSDYINANYVTGPKDMKGYYIACQAPLQNTIEDFWRMVWEQQSKLILMITHLFENGTEKCADYMPPSEITDCHRLFGDFQVTLKKREVKDKYIISSLQLKNMVSNSWREVTHFWYLGWPEKGVPLEANSLIAYLIEARSYIKNPLGDNGGKNKANRNGQYPETSPIVVHCSPGTGRTGTVIACDIAIREFELSRLVDIPKIVYKIRRDRASSVQTKDQYAFIYKVISVYATKLTGGSFDSL